MDEPVSKAAPAERLRSIDAYRGFVMLAMASGGLGFAQVARREIEAKAQPWLWDFLVAQTDHVAWRGGCFWDMIQPSFMFLAGVSLPFGDAARAARGESWGRRFGHVLYRSVLLVLLGIFLESNGQIWSEGAQGTNFSFVNVLTQIGLGYWAVFLLLKCSPRVRIAASMAILAADWLLFAAYPAHDGRIDFNALKLPDDWLFLPGFLGHWEKNLNVGTAVDRVFLNLFPRPDGKPFTVNSGGYVTINFLPSIATMVFGTIAGNWLRSRYTGPSKVKGLVLAGAACLVVALGMDETICPIVKRIWTPSWVFFSTAFTCWILAAFYGVIDVAKLRRWSFPLVVVGANSIAMYVMAQLLKPWVRETLKTHLGTIARPIGRRVGIPVGPNVFAFEFGPIVEASAVLLVLWLICLWMYRRRIFLKI